MLPVVPFLARSLSQATAGSPLKPFGASFGAGAEESLAHSTLPSCVKRRFESEKWCFRVQKDVQAEDSRACWDLIGPQESQSNSG